MPLIRDYTQADSLDPTDAFILDRVGVGTMYIEGLDLAVGAPYAPAFEFLGDPAGESEILGAQVFPVAVAFPDGLGGLGVCATLPTASFVAIINKISGATTTALGTMTIGTDGVFTFAASAVSFAAGESLQFVGPSVPDATAANFWWTLLGATA